MHIALPTAVLHLADYNSACYRHLNFNQLLALPIDTPEPKLSPLVEAGTIYYFILGGLFQTVWLGWRWCIQSQVAI